MVNRVERFHHVIRPVNHLNVYIANVQCMSFAEEGERLSSVVVKSKGARCSSVVRVFAHGAMDRRLDPSW